MSISRPNTGLERPTQKYIKFKSGKFEYWDKKQERTVEIPLPIKFTVLDELCTISGYYEKSNSGIFSNEVHFTTKEILDVKSFKGDKIANGLYGDIKDKVKANGGRYTKSVYAMIDDEIVNIQISGASLSSWMDKEDSIAYQVSKLGEGKKGATVYKFPIFDVTEVSDEEIEKAKRLDEKLQDYLDEYKKKDDASTNEPKDDYYVEGEEIPFPNEY